MESSIMKERKIVQIGIVVRDLEKALKQYCEIFDTGPWDIYEFGPPEMKHGTYRGNPSDWSALIGFNWIGDRQMEIIQPLQGPNIYFEFLEKKGEGFHHIKEYVTDPQITIEKYRKKGISVIQSGEFDAGSFYYLDTEPFLGFTLEIVKDGPRKHREPDRRYPEG
jgi:methylmalonyl-CoA/ethylmalonyl-CoA epimerase